MLPPVEAPAAAINFGAGKCEKISRLVIFIIFQENLQIIHVYRLILFSKLSFIELL